MKQVRTRSLRDRIAARLRPLVNRIRGAATLPKPPPKAKAFAGIAAPAARVPPEARRIVVHPGLPKTGTTSIQQSFHKNQAALLARGILYPKLEINHTLPILALFYGQIGTNPRFMRMPPDEQAAYVQNARDALAAELSDPGWHTLILSGEGISHMKGEEWRAFRAWLAAYSPNIEIIFGLRSAMDMVRSSIQQNLKTGRILEDLYSQPSSLHPRARLESILAAFAVPAIKLWDFDAAVQSPEGLVANFATSIGLDEEVAAMLGATRTFTNPSLSQLAVEKLDARNRAQAVRTPINKALLNELSAIGGPKFQLPDAVIAKARAQLAPDMVWIRDTFGFEGVRSDPPLPP